MESIANSIAIRELQKEVSYLTEILRMMISVREGMGDELDDIEEMSIGDLYVAYAEKLWNEIDGND